MKEKRKLKLPVKILIGMIIGVAAGLIFGEKITYIGFIGDIFMNLLKMCILPLILLSIISGASQVADMAKLKKVGLTFAAYAITTTMLASVIGIAFATIFKPGKGITLTETEAVEGVAAETDILASFVNWIPTNPFNSLAEGNTIQIIVFALIFGVILASVRGTETGELVFKGVEALNDIIYRIVNWVISLAPIGVCVLTAETVGALGLEVLGGLGKLLIALYLGMLCMLLVAYPLILLITTHLNPIKFFKNVYPVFIMALSTCSSSATLPVTLKTARERNGVPADISGIIAPLAATINMDGAALEHPMYVVFAAQLFGLQLSFPQMLILVLLGVIISAGSAGMPGSGVVMATLMLEIMGLPLTMIPWLAGIYILIDLVSTLINVTGDSVGMVVVAHAMGELDESIYNS